MPDLLEKNQEAIKLVSRMNVLGGDVALLLTDMELDQEDAEILCHKLMMLKDLEADIQKAEALSKRPKGK